MLKQAQYKLAEKISDFAGSMTFVWIHTVWFALWFIFKLDINMLTLIVSLEAIYLSTFILITQNRVEDTTIKLAEQDAEQDKEFDEIQEDVDDIQEDVDEMQEDVDEMQEDIEGIEKDVDEIAEDVEEIHDDIVEIAEDVDQIHTQFESLHKEMAEIKKLLLANAKNNDTQKTNVK